MKQKIIILTLIMCFGIPFFSTDHGSKVRAQLPVTDALNMAIHTVVRDLTKTATKIHEWMQELEKMKVATDAIDQIQSIREIAGLVDDVACLTSEFQFLMNINGTYRCATFLNFRLISVNLNYSTNILNKIILVKNIFTMESSDRINFLETVRKTLEKTITDMRQINNTIRGHFNKKIFANSIKRNYYSKAAFVAYRRY